MANTKVTSAVIADNAVGVDQLNVSDGTNGQVLTTNGSGTLSFGDIPAGYTDSDVETYLNTSTIYTDATNDRLGIGTSTIFGTTQISNTAWSSGSPYGTVLTVTGNNTNDANWGHLLISDSTTTTGNGGMIRFATGSTASDMNPFAGIDGFTEGSAYGGLKFLTRPSGGTATARMTIDSSGNVGIGTSTFSATYDKLAVAGGIHIQDDNSAKLEIGRYSSGASNSYIKLGANSNALKITNNTDSADIFTILNSGNVGIKSTSPDYSLSVAGLIEAEGATELAGTNAGANFLHYSTNNYSYFSGAYGANGVFFGEATGSTRVGMQSGQVMTFETNAAERMRIDSSGNVGIGTSSPSEALHVNSRAKIGNITLAGNSTDSTLSAGNANFKISTLQFTGGAGGLDFDIFLAITGGIQRVFQVEASGAGDTYTNDGTISSLSDERVKTDIQDLTDGLEIVKQLRPVTFKYNDTSTSEEGHKLMGGASDKVRYGFIAQEVEQIAPQYVEYSTRKINNEEVDDFRNLSTTRMLPMLFKAVQEQQTIIDDLKARIETLENA